jgi:hypothetical protein
VCSVQCVNQAPYPEVWNNLYLHVETERSWGGNENIPLKHHIT